MAVKVWVQVQVRCDEVFDKRGICVTICSSSQSVLIAYNSYTNNLTSRGYFVQRYKGCFSLQTTQSWLRLAECEATCLGGLAYFLVYGSLLGVFFTRSEELSDACARRLINANKSLYGGTSMDS